MYGWSQQSNHIAELDVWMQSFAVKKTILASPVCTIEYCSGKNKSSPEVYSEMDISRKVAFGTSLLSVVSLTEPYVTTVSSSDVGGQWK